jgi:TonB family protein
LDERPRPKSQVEPEFPLVVDPGVVGVVIARLFIDDEGRVERVVVEKATPTGLFEEAVHKAFADARYTPGMRKGRPVAAQLRIEIEFRSNPLM